MLPRNFISVLKQSNAGVEIVMCSCDTRWAPKIHTAISYSWSFSEAGFGVLVDAGSCLCWQHCLTAATHPWSSQHAGICSVLSGAWTFSALSPQLWKPPELHHSSFSTVVENNCIGFYFKGPAVQHESTSVWVLLCKSQDVIVMVASCIQANILV